mmetsp:Transcript_31347/g.97637  ORF Transcript_31347/g.97637 Transcript_31347/m.97637 type:complete len:296 (-) Transcript_31347:17-904(-)
MGRRGEPQPRAARRLRHRGGLRGGGLRLRQRGDARARPQRPALLRVRHAPAGRRAVVRRLRRQVPRGQPRQQGRLVLLLRPAQQRQLGGPARSVRAPGVGPLRTCGQRRRDRPGPGRGRGCCGLRAERRAAGRLRRAQGAALPHHEPGPGAGPCGAAQTPAGGCPSGSPGGPGWPAARGPGYIRWELELRRGHGARAVRGVRVRLQLGRRSGPAGDGGERVGRPGLHGGGRARGSAVHAVLLLCLAPGLAQGPGPLRPVGRCGHRVQQVCLRVDRCLLHAVGHLVQADMLARMGV